MRRHKIIKINGQWTNLQNDPIEEADSLIPELNQQYNYLPSIDEIPTDPDEFYRDLGLLEHPFTRQPVPHLTEYQKRVWREGQRRKYRLVVKSQKVGMTTSTLMEDFQKAITTCRGKEILLIAQSLDHAKDHLYTLRKMVKASKKYSGFIIDRPTEFLLKDEVSKVMMLYIANPDNPYKPTRIIALGPRAGSIWSWKEVAHIHVSDITAATAVEDSEIFGAAFSRLANTGGSMIVETPPRGPSGKVYEIYELSKLKPAKTKANPENNFKVIEIPVDAAVEAGLVSEEFLEGERNRLGPMYSMFYECEFFAKGNVWYSKDLFSYADDYQLESV